MNKPELVSKIAEHTGLTKVDSEKALNAFQDIVIQELETGGKVQLVGFGTFEVGDRAERNGVNPQTREPLVIPATKTPKFRAGSTFKLAVKG